MLHTNGMLGNFQQGGKQFIYFEQNEKQFISIFSSTPPPPPQISNGTPLSKIVEQ